MQFVLGNLGWIITMPFLVALLVVGYINWPR